MRTSLGRYVSPSRLLSSQIELYNARDSIVDFRLNGEPLVVLCARYNSHKCLLSLLKLRADVNAKCCNLRSALWHAARNGNAELIRQLYGYGAEIDEPDILGITPFASACAKGFLCSVECLCRFSPSLATNHVTLSSGETWPPLFLSMGYGHRRVSEFLMSKCGPISLTYRDHEGRSALFMAVNSGAYELAHLLLHRVLEFKLPDCKQRALELLCRPNNSNVTPLWLASLYGDLGSMEWILSTLRNTFEYTDEQIAQHVNTPDCRNASPLFVAVQEGNAECVRRLINNRAEIDFEPRAGLSITSPLIKACAFGSLEIVKILLHSGAKREGDLHTLVVATAMHQRHIVRYLDRTRGFCSRLHYLDELPADLVLELLRAGADIHCTGEGPGGVSPLGVAMKLASSGRRISPQIDYVMKAGKAWNFENHCTFPSNQRSLASFVFTRFALSQYANVPTEVWTSEILPFLISRGPPLSRTELNKIRPGDGRNKLQY